MNGNQNPYTRTDLDSIKTSAQYKQVRISLLLVIVFSVLNIFAMSFADMYFLFSSYLTQVIAAVGAGLFLETQNALFLVVFFGLALASVIPYILFFIFSKKHVGWMIAALVLFSLDSLLFLVDFVGFLLAGDYSFVFDLLIRAYVLWSLIMGVKYGKKLQKKNPYAINLEFAPSATAASAFAANTAGQSAEPAVMRTLTLTRKKRFSGCAMQLNCYIDGQLAASFKNGETKTVPVDANAHEVVVMAPQGHLSGSMMLPADSANRSYEFAIKMGMVTSTVIFTEQV